MPNDRKNHTRVIGLPLRMQWIALTDDSQIEDIKTHSKTTPQVIFKHSTRCSISSMAKSRLERYNEPIDIPFYLLDLLRFRELSNKLAGEFQVHHESPQILLIKNGDCVFEESHTGINMPEILEEAGKAN